MFKFITMTKLNFNGSNLPIVESTKVFVYYFASCEIKEFEVLATTATQKNVFVTLKDCDLPSIEVSQTAKFVAFREYMISTGVSGLIKGAVALLSSIMLQSAKDDFAKEFCVML